MFYVLQYRIDRTRLFTRTFLSWKLKNLFNLVSVFIWFAADLKIWFMCCLEFSLWYISASRSFTWDAALISLGLILKISFVWSCFLMFVIRVLNFLGFTIILFSLNQSKATSHSDSKDPINSWIVLLNKQERCHLQNYAQLLIKWNERSH